jgi:hypothetical protein
VSGIIPFIFQPSKQKVLLKKKEMSAQDRQPQLGKDIVKVVNAMAKAFEAVTKATGMLHDVIRVHQLQIYVAEGQLQLSEKAVPHPHYLAAAMFALARAQESANTVSAAIAAAIATGGGGDDTTFRTMLDSD